MDVQSQALDMNWRRDRTRPDSRMWPRLIVVALAAASVAMLILLVLVGRWLTFWYDEWDFVFVGPTLTAASLLTPHVNHLSIVPILAYQALLQLFGLGSYWPFLAATWLLHMLSVWLLFRLSSRTAGLAVGFLAGISLLFLGSAFEDLLQAFQLSFLASTAAGLFVLDRLVSAQDGSRRIRDLVWAGVGMLVAVGSSSVGVLFLGVVLAYALLKRDRSAIAALLPAIAAYGAWYLTWGRLGGSVAGQVTPGGLVTMVETLLFGLGAAVSGVVGLPPERFALAGLAILVVAALAVIAMRLRFSALGVAALLGFAAEYLLQAYFRADFGVQHAARSGYLYPAAIFLWLAVSDLVAHSWGPIALTPESGRATAPWVARRAGLLVLISLMILGNMLQFVGAARAMRDLRATEVAELQLLERLRGASGLTADISPDPGLMPQVTPARYFEAIDRFGSPTTGFWLDPKASVDEDAVAAAALRLLTPKIITMSGTVSGPDPAQLVAHGAGVNAVSPGCIEVAPQGATYHIALGVPDGAFTLSGPGVRDVTISLGLSGYPGEPLPVDLGQAVQRGSALGLSRLPGTLTWVVYVDGVGSAPVGFCSIVGP
jgi:hypothetical protein